MTLDDDSSPGGTQSIERAVALLLRVARAGPDGLRLSDLVAGAGLTKPTVRRVLLALVRSGLLEQEPESRRYHIGPETFVLGTLASSRFGIHALAQGSLSRLSRETGDTVFLSVARDSYAVCLHREEGSYPIRTHVLQAGDRHPLGVGAGSLALLAALDENEVEHAIEANAKVIAERYKNYSPLVLRALVERTRVQGYALNPGMLMSGSWGIGVAVRGPDGRPAGAVSLAAVENRLDDLRRHELVPLLKREAQRLEAQLRQPASLSGENRVVRAKAPPTKPAKRQTSRATSAERRLQHR